MSRFSCFVALGALFFFVGCEYHELHDDHSCGDGDWGPHHDGRDRDRPDGAGGGGDHVGCASAADCADGELCVEAACIPSADACRFDSECGAGRSCVDNACRPLCSDDSACSAGTACTTGRCQPTAECAAHDECEAGERCLDGRCLASCSGDADCGADEVCGVGDACRPDTAPRPFCSDDSECAAGHICVDGVCRTPCVTETNEECLRWDNQLTRCADSGAGLWLCYTENEHDPECVTADECEADRACIDAICR